MKKDIYLKLAKLAAATADTNAESRWDNLLMREKSFTALIDFARRVQIAQGDAERAARENTSSAQWGTEHIASHKILIFLLRYWDYDEVARTLNFDTEVIEWIAELVDNPENVGYRYMLRSFKDDFLRTAPSDIAGSKHWAIGWLLERSRYRSSVNH